MVNELVSLDLITICRFSIDFRPRHRISGFQEKKLDFHVKQSKTEHILSTQNPIKHKLNCLTKNDSKLSKEKTNDAFSNQQDKFCNCDHLDYKSNIYAAFLVVSYFHLSQAKTSFLNFWVSLVVGEPQEANKLFLRHYQGLMYQHLSALLPRSKRCTDSLYNSMDDTMK